MFEMTLKDVFNKLNLSGIGARANAKFASLRQKFPFKRSPTPETADEIATPEAATDEAQGNAFKRLTTIAAEKIKNSAADFRTKAVAFGQRLKENLPKDANDLKKLQPDEIFERLRNIAGGRNSGVYLRLAASLFAAYFLADTVSLFTDSLIPDPPPVPAAMVRRTDDKHRSISEYDAITANNIFLGHQIPEMPTNPSIARKTNLPLHLIGTVVLRDELKSIATIEDKSQNMVFPVRIEDTVNDRIQIKRIEHLKVTFLNLSTGNMEYVEIVDDQPSLRLESRPTTSRAKSEGGVTRIDETHVQVEQKVIRDGMANLNEVLQQARAIPNFENGMPDGYKILQIVPGSIFDKFGIQNGDVIVGLDGEPINDPGKALALLNDLPNKNHVEIGIKRGGRKMTMSFDIK